MMSLIWLSDLFLQFTDGQIFADSNGWPVDFLGGAGWWFLGAGRHGFVEEAAVDFSGRGHPW